jgi:hypothetical protein
VITAADRVERLRTAFARRDELDVKALPAPAGSVLVRVAWTHNTLARGGYTEDRRVVRWYGYVGDMLVDSGVRKRSVVEALRDYLDR